MTLLEKVKELQAVTPPLDGSEINRRLQEWKGSGSLLDDQMKIKSNPLVENVEDNLAKLNDSADVVPVVGSNENLELQSALGLLDSLESLKFDLDNPKDNITQVETETNETAVDAIATQPVTDIDLPINQVPEEYLNVQKDFTKTVDRLFKSNTPYQLGISGKSITDLDKDFDFEKKIRAKAKENYTALYGNLPNEYNIDVIVKQVKNKYLDQENEEARITTKNNAANSKARGDYKFVLDSGIEQQVSEFNKQEQLISNLNKKARDLQKIINTTNDFQTRSQAENELSNVAKEAEQAKKGLRYNYAFDPLTGRRAGTVEEIKNSEDWTGEIEELETEYKSLDLESLEQAYFTHVIEFNDLQEDLDSRIDLGGKALNPFLRRSLINGGYKPDEKGVFREVAYKDLMRWQDQTIDILQESIYVDPEEKKKGGGAMITVNLADELKDYSKRRNELLKEREAFKLAYLLNIDSSSLNQNLGDVIQRFGETVSEATIGENLTRSTFGTSRRKQIDFLTDLSRDIGIKLTKEQEDNAERTLGMKVL